MALLISIATFVVVALASLAVWLLVAAGGRQEVVRQRMEAVQKAERRGGEIATATALLRDEMLSSVPAVHRVLARWSWSTRLRELISQSGLKVKPANLLTICGVVGLATYLLMGYYAPRFPLPLVAGLALSAAPMGIVMWIRRSRFRKFEEHFPEALDLLGRAVRAGHAFTTGLEMISKEAPEPIASEFRKTFDEQNFGLPLRDALLNLAERVPLIDVRFFVTALLIQKETGGNLAEILDGLSRVIRDRFRIYREVGVKTAQGRLTAAILIGLPPVLIAVLGALNPHYEGMLFADPAGTTVLMIAAGLQILGSIILWKIVHIDV
ncbi:MAG TPA: type II secretion system F family protein [Candidatus Cybelea sp.]|nr:type II secretion system F family protein [Candidatus Cybelea sp.]